jgi:hypothetical protein
MKPEQVLEALEDVATKLGIDVRYEALAASGVNGGGGLCKVKGQWWVLIDKKSTPAERIALLADALTNFDTRAFELPQKLRDMIAPRSPVASALESSS